MSSRSSAALLVLLLAAATVGHAAGAPARSATTAPTTPLAAETQLQQNGTLPNTTLVLHIQPNGDAQWSISTRFRIDDENDREAFNELATSFQNGETASLGLPAFREARARASAASGRPMSINSVTRSKRLSNGTGTLVLEFTWTNFSRTAGDRIYVGDAFNTSDGGWLTGLTERQTLVIRPPDGYSVNSAPIRVINRTLRWQGPTEFERAEPWVVYETSENPGTVTTTTTATTTTATTTTVGPPGQSGDVPWGVILVGGGALALAAYALGGRFGGTVPGTGADETPATGTTDESAPNGDDAPTTASPETESTGESEATASADEDAGAASAGAAAAAGAEDDIDEALLSDEERVERLLEANGGRMKQATIVEETGWSNAKVSQLLSSMAEEGRIEKLRLGRENLISFPDEDIGEFDS